MPLRRSIRRWPACLALLALLALLVGCGADYGQNLEDLDTVATVHDPAAAFSAYLTFAIPDAIAPAQGALDTLDHRYDAQILAQVVAEMQAIGYVLEPDPAARAPDLNVLVSAATTQFTTVFQPYAFWPTWGFWDGWDWYPGFGVDWTVSYPWAGTYGAVSFDVGTLLIDIWDARNIDPNAKQVRAVWEATISGLLADQPNRILARSGPQIHQAFVQSPYLGRKGGAW